METNTKDNEKKIKCMAKGNLFMLVEHNMKAISIKEPKVDLE